MKTILMNVYQFSELSETAKEKAREWYRSCSDSSDLDCVISYFEQICDIIGLELSTRSVPLMNGKTREEPEVYYSVSYSQGDYAAFSGTWGYIKGCKKAIREYAPKDSELHSIVSDWQALQKVNFYQLIAHCEDHHFNGQRVTGIERNDDKGTCGCVETEARALVYRLSSWLYKQLRSEVDYQNSDEYVDEAIRANEYEFYENGERA